MVKLATYLSVREYSSFGMTRRFSAFVGGAETALSIAVL